MTEDPFNQMGPYKAALRKPSISQTAREHAQSVIDDLEGNQAAQGAQDKESIRRTAGLKAAMYDPDAEGKKTKKQGGHAPQE
ncbi:hypothetical protein ASPVEDRAFT_156148 [Aspergillus versicolor CBS 583.65]|uniref:Uncharacterized protein n=1 Tax=Aspergillus versicolor CBS 583.65 TaxID=1036611 RepID=A0A1L9Q417_ASPVE|nr:uncharacterized protein ASPVEDRAFT_156148 [Aspergillus versicolor CBS 583.65]OJJ08510.1 hypothetical protein ASPVEDRAFT_156148 [Aspergillus versicolor CBS 583.65]